MELCKYIITTAVRKCKNHKKSYFNLKNTVLSSIYHLIYKEGMSANTFQRMKNGKAITTQTLDTLCFILDCEVEDIIRHNKTK